MRRSILFLCFLISVNGALACGPWYPWGEDLRFSIYSPKFFDDGGMSEFYYSANVYSEMYVHSAESDRNVDDWHNACEGQVSKKDVFKAVYRLSAKEIQSKKSADPFVKKMIGLGKMNFLEYLSFAKKYSYLNSANNDPWERGTEELDSKREKVLSRSKLLAEETNDKILKRRYAFVAIRMAFYRGNRQEVEQLYSSYFEGKDEMTIDKWARYFKLKVSPPTALRNFMLAQLFENTPSKRHGIFVMFNRKIDINEVMNYAESNEEKANVLVLYSVRKLDRQLDNIRKIHQLNPNNELLPFLIVREINKLENWVLSPTYTAFNPVMRKGIEYDSAEELIKKGILADKKYAKQMVGWLNSIKSSLDAELHVSALVMSQFIADDAIGAYETLNKASFSNGDRTNWKNRMIGMLRIASSETSNSENLDLKVYLDDQYPDRDRLLFLIGRLFEFRGDLGNAASFYSKLNEDESYWYPFVWADPKGIGFDNVSFYYDYYDYFDANYKAKDIIGIINFAKSADDNPKLRDLVSKINYDNVRMLDLVGTKYLREANLSKSMEYLQKVPMSYWKSDKNSYSIYLASNPFYANFYSAHEKTKADTIVYTKYEIVKKLSELIALEKTQKGNQKAKTNFTIANCYFNMTTHGNSWMMRRSFWSTYTYNTVYVDSDEFNKCILARSYYMKASRATESDEFEAVCLRMAGRCEAKELYFDEEHPDNYGTDYDPFGGYTEYMFDQNETYKLLDKKYPQWHDELVTNCESFNRFYHSI